MRAFLLTLFFSLFTIDARAAEATAGLIAELVGVEQEIRDTHWTFDTRDQKKALEEKVKLIRRILGTVADYEAVLVECSPIVTQSTPRGSVTVRVPRTISTAEIALIERVVRIDDEIDRGDWGFSNRDEEKALVEEKERAKETLARITSGLCGDNRVVTVLPR